MTEVIYRVDNRGKVNGRWAEIEAVVAELGLFEAEVPGLTHGLCSDCQQQMLGDPLLASGS